VGQGVVETRLRLEKRAISHELAGTAEAQGGGEHPGASVERHETALGHRPVDHHDVVLGTGVAEHLDLHVVLVRPEVRDGHVRAAVAGTGDQAAGRGHSLIGGIGPVLDPDVGTEALVEPAGHVSRHHDVVGGVQRGVGHDTV